MNAPDPIAIPAEFAECFSRQRAAYLAQPMPDYASRCADLQSLARMIRENQEAIVAAISADFGNRSGFETRFAEIFIVLAEIKHSAAHLKKWMKPQRRNIDFLMYPTSSNRVTPQPLGMVGVIAPWNFPLMTALAPLSAIFAAGNRAMVKMSENSPRLAQLLISVSPKYFPPEKLQVFEDAGRGPALSSIPFDHIIFTGSTQTGRAVMAKAARNLTPVTLELGGKSPAIVAPDFPVETAAGRILWLKAFNAGQTCTNIDYMFLPEGCEADFTQAALRLIAERYPDINHPDYTSIIDERSYQRLQAALDDAIAKGARAINLFPGQTPDRTLRKFPLTLLFGVTEDMTVLQREIFGPLLPVKTYRASSEVVEYINGRDRPLALYPFAKNRALQDYYVNHIMSGGATINHTGLHAAQCDMPFGGVGASGMGHYHGHEGFVTFSKMRPIFRLGPLTTLKPMMPPYDKGANTLIKWVIKFKG